MFPEIPSVPDDQRGTGQFQLRFEDLTQDGRILFEPVVASIGPAIWASNLARHPTAAAMQADGIRPIFTYLMLEAFGAQLDLAAPVTATGVYELAHERGKDGAVVRLYLNMWTEVSGRARQTGEQARAARLFAEHVLTRPYAPPERRRVTEVPGLELPRATYRQRLRDELLSLPPGATWLEPAVHPDAMPASFGIAHTDINRHVNSLVYPRLFEDAALRRFSSLGKGSKLLARTLEVAFRKPFFAGDSAVIRLRAFGGGDELGATGVFVDAGAPTGDGSGEAAEPKPHAYVRMRFLP